MMERRLMKEGLTVESLKAAKRIRVCLMKRLRISSKLLPKKWKTSREKRAVPDFKMVDTCAAEFEAHTPYYYSAYGAEDEVKPQGKGSVVDLAPVRSASGRASNLTTAPFMLPGLSGRQERNPSSSTTTRKPFRPILIHPIPCTLNH